MPDAFPESTGREREALVLIARYEINPRSSEKQGWSDDKA